MISIEITGIKDFMNKLLGSEAFDSFYLEEATIVTFNTFVIDGHTVNSFYKGTDKSVWFFIFAWRSADFSETIHKNRWK